MSSGWLSRGSIRTLCTIDIEHTHDAFHAHVELDPGVAIGPGDRVHVHGEPIRVAFGQHIKEHRPVTVERAGWLLSAWTRLCAWFALNELYEVSFTPTRML